MRALKKYSNAATGYRQNWREILPFYRLPSNGTTGCIAITDAVFFRGAFDVLPILAVILVEFYDNEVEKLFVLDPFTLVLKVKN